MSRRKIPCFTLSLKQVDKVGFTLQKEKTLTLRTLALRQAQLKSGLSDYFTTVSVSAIIFYSDNNNTLRAKGKRKKCKPSERMSISVLVVIYNGCFLKLEPRYFKTTRLFTPVC